MAPERISILYNPSAGMGRALRRKLEIERLLRHFEVRYDLIMTRSEEHLRKLTREHAQTYRTVVGAGGDSTFHIMINEIMKAGTGVSFGLIGVGSSNDIPIEFGIDSFEKACRALKSGHTRRIDLGCVFEGQAPLAYFLGQANIGLGAFVNMRVAELAVRRPWLARRQTLAGIMGVRNAFRSKKIPMPLRIEGQASSSPLARGLNSRASAAEEDLQTKPGAPAGVLARSLLNTRASTAEVDPQAGPGAPADAGVRANAPAPAAVDSEAGRAEGDFVAAIFSNIRFWATGKIINPEAVPDDGLLDACLIEPCSFLRLARISSLAGKGRHLEAREVRTLRAASFEISSEKPFEIQSDGEIIKDSGGRSAFNKITLSVVPGALSLICP